MTQSGSSSPAPTASSAPTGPSGLLARMLGLLALVLTLVALGGQGEAEAAATCGQVFDARADFGATPDDASDDTAALQAALDAAGGTGPDCRGSVHLPAGTYETSGSLATRSYSGLSGDGMDTTTIRVGKDAGGGADPMIMLRDVSHVTIEGLHLDGNNSGRVQPDDQRGITLSGARDSAIRRIKISDLGDDQGGRGPGGAHIRFNTYEIGDPKATDHPWKTAGINTENNTIENNVFDDSGVVSSFGVNLNTNWKHPKRDDQFDFFVRNNKIQNNRFYGFYWNAVELGGPATRTNTVYANKFYNTRQTPLDADKGAKLNKFTYNVVVGVTQAPGNGISAGIRVQGRPRTCDPGDPATSFDDDVAPQRFAEGNVFRNNTIRNVSSSRPNWAAAGAALSWAKNTTIANNRFYNVRPGPGGRVYAILEQDFSYAPTTGLRSSGNTLDGRPATTTVRPINQPAPCR